MTNNRWIYWQALPTIQRRLFEVLLALSGLLLVAYFLFMYTGNDLVYTIKTDYTLKPIAHVLETFEYLGFPVEVQGKSYMLTGFYSVNPLSPDSWFIWLVYGLSISGLALLITLTTYFSRILYYIVMVVLVAGIVMMRPDVLGVFGLPNQLFLGIIIALVAGTSYYFVAFKSDLSFGKRLLVFVGLFTLICGVVTLGASMGAAPTIAAHYGMFLPIGLTLIFIYLTGFDIPAMAYEILTDSKEVKSKPAMLNFSLFSLFYVSNVALSWFHSSGKIRWDILYLNPYWLFPISCIAGLYSWHKRGEIYEGNIPFKKAGALIYPILMVISLATIAWVFKTANDPLIEVFEDAISLVYATMSLAFTIYVLINFYDVKLGNQKLHLVLYQPNFMPLRTVYMFSTVLIFSGVIFTHKLAINQSLSGYNNILGDCYLKLGMPSAAKQFYKEGKNKAYLNNHSNYGLANIFIAENQPDSAKEYLGNALLKNALPQTYLFKAWLDLDKENPTISILTTNEGLSKYPNNEYLTINKAYFYQNGFVKDSMDVAFKKAEVLFPNNELLLSNKLYQAVKQADLTALKNVVQNTKATTIGLQANLLAIKNFLGESDTTYNWESHHKTDTLGLDADQMAFLYNYGLNASLRADTTIAKVIRMQLSFQGNKDLDQFLGISLGYNLYYGGNTYLGFRTLGLNEDKYGGTEANITNFLARLQFKEGAYLKSVDLFNKYGREITTDSYLYYNLAYAEYPKFRSDVIRDLSRIAATRPDTLGKIAGKVASALQISVGALPNASEYELFIALYYRMAELPTDLVNSYRENISNPQLKSLINGRFMGLLAERKEYELAFSIYEKEGRLKGANANAIALLDKQMMQLLMQTGNVTSLKAVVAQAANSPVAKKDYLVFKAGIAQLEKDTATASKLFLTALNASPMDEFTVLRSSSYFNSVGKGMQGYNVLLEGLDFNPYSIKLKKAYILQATALGFDGFAGTALQQLRFIMPEGDYAIFANSIGMQIQQQQATETTP
jgi:hypothetical protein